MARKLRIQYEGAIYHLMNRGDHRENIFLDDPDRELFLKTLGEACEKTDWQLHAWCLMSNHFHLVVETPKANLVDGMKWFLGTYTSRFNRRHKLFGHLFSGRYKSLFVDGSGNGYLKTACDYVHLNPARAKLLSAKQKLWAYRWSSYGEYLKPKSQRWPWLRVNRLLGEHGIPKDSPAGREQFEARMGRLSILRTDPFVTTPLWTQAKLEPLEPLRFFARFIMWQPRRPVRKRFAIRSFLRSNRGSGWSRCLVRAFAGLGKD